MERYDLILTIGISGSGKSTWANLADIPDKEIVCPDLIRKELTGNVSDQSANQEVFRIVDKRIRHALENGKTVILDATNVNTKFRRKDLEKWKSKGYAVAYKVFPSETDTCYSRVSEDIKKGVDRSDVPIHAIERQHSMWLKSLDDILEEDAVILC